MQAFKVMLGKREIDKIFYSSSDKVTAEDVMLNKNLVDQIMDYENGAMRDEEQVSFSRVSLFS